MTDEFQGIKTIQIHATTRYPIVSAYEFEFLKTEDQVKALLKPCTIYFILQRPLVYINNLDVADGEISFEIVDDTSHSPLKCRFAPSATGITRPNEDLLVDVQFYKKTAPTVAPFSEVAGFKLWDTNKRFLGWFSPQLFLFEYLNGNLKADIEGNILDYLDYTVHYIGKAFAQDIWNRLTGHEKMQSILTMEDALNTQSLKAPFEVALLMLEIDGFDEANVFPSFDFVVDDNVEPIVYTFTSEDDDERFEEYYAPKLLPRAEELTTEVEALLVNTFKPQYNDILFENYPKIRSGTRSAGYTQSRLLIENLPAVLKTALHTQGIIYRKAA